MTAEVVNIPFQSTPDRSQWVSNPELNLHQSFPSNCQIKELCGCIWDTQCNSMLMLPQIKYLSYSKQQIASFLLTPLNTEIPWNKVRQGYSSLLEASPTPPLKTVRLLPGTVLFLKCITLWFILIPSLFIYQDFPQVGLWSFWVGCFKGHSFSVLTNRNKHTWRNTGKQLFCVKLLLGSHWLSELIILEFCQITLSYSSSPQSTHSSSFIHHCSNSNETRRGQTYLWI